MLIWVKQPQLLRLQWVGPNIISGVLSSPEEVASKIAVIMGPRGERGERGIAGDGSDTFIWSPPDVLDTWVIAHNLGKFPAVTVVDSLGRVLTSDVTYLDNNLVEIAFAFPVSGTAYLN
jgi:hypothetical protein